LGELGTMIRAVQGHSTDAVDRTFVAKVPPVILYHGTAERFVESIKKSGLLPQSRHHVHLSSDIETAVKVGQRHGKVVVIEVDAKAMLADSHRFYQAENGVWLTDAVPVKYLKF
jgi:putative RNA 2'-phosphotransferase